LLRLGFIFGTHSYINPEVVEPGVIAHALITGKGFSFAVPGSAINLPTASQPPLFPYLLAGLYILFGENELAYLALAIIQTLLSIWLCYLVYRIGTIAFNERTGLVAMLFSAVYPIFIIYSGRTTNTMISILAVAWFLYLFFQFTERPTNRFRNIILLGISAGLAIFAESIMLSFIILGFLWYLLVQWRTKKSVSIRFLVVAILISAAVVLPWTIRNYLVFHKFVAVRTMFGMNLWQGNNPQATGTNTLPDGKPMFDFPPEYYNLSLTEPDRDTILLNAAKQFIFENPGKAARLFLKKCYYFWWFPPNNIVTPAAAKYANLMWFPFLLLLIFVLIGTGYAIKNKCYFALGIFWLLFFNYMVVYGITHFGHFRYRAPIEPYLLILAAYGLTNLIRQIISKEQEKLKKIKTDEI